MTDEIIETRRLKIIRAIAIIITFILMIEIMFFQAYAFQYSDTFTRNSWKEWLLRIPFLKLLIGC